MILSEIKDKINLSGELNLHQKRNVLFRRIEAWRAVQDIYCPGTVTLRKTEVEAENTELLLPSALPSHILVSSTAQQVLVIERKLRRAQMEDALSDLRHWRRALHQVTQFKNLNTRGK